jgi:hypothetical protein
MLIECENVCIYGVYCLNIALFDTHFLFNELLEYNNWMLGKLSHMLNFSSIQQLYFEDPLNKQWVLSNVMKCSNPNMYRLFTLNEPTSFHIASTCLLSTLLLTMPM